MWSCKSVYVSIGNQIKFTGVLGFYYDSDNTYKKWDPSIWTYHIVHTWEVAALHHKNNRMRDSFAAYNWEEKATDVINKYIT